MEGQGKYDCLQGKAHMAAMLFDELIEQYWPMIEQEEVHRLCELRTKIVLELVQQDLNSVQF